MATVIPTILTNAKLILMNETRSITLNLNAATYEALIAEAKAVGTSEAELVERALQLLLRDKKQNLLVTIESVVNEQLEGFERDMTDRFYTLMEQHISQAEFQQLKANLASQSAAIAQLINRELVPSQDNPTEPLSTLEQEITPSTKQLEIGDLVQVRDVDSPYFMEKLKIIKVGIIRASVATNSGEQSFLKRDLRFVSS